MHVCSRVLPCLLLLGATGCWPGWPRLDKPWPDYEQSMVFAHLEWSEPQGGYWSDNSPSGQVFWGVFAQPRQITGYEFDGPTGQCASVAAYDFSVFDASGGGSTVLKHGGGSVSVPWNSSSDVYAANLAAGDFDPSADYDLSQVQFGSYPAFAIPGLIHTPSDDFHLDSPVIDGTSPATVDLGNLSFTWSGTVSQQVAIVVVVYSGNTLTDSVECVVDDTGSLSVPADLFPNSANATEVIVFAGPITLTTGPVPIGDGDSYRAAASDLKAGALFVSGGG